VGEATDKNIYVFYPKKCHATYAKYAYHDQKKKQLPDSHIVFYLSASLFKKIIEQMVASLKTL